MEFKRANLFKRLLWEKYSTKSILNLIPQNMKIVASPEENSKTQVFMQKTTTSPPISIMEFERHVEQPVHCLFRGHMSVIIHLLLHASNMQ